MRTIDSGNSMHDTTLRDTWLEQNYELPLVDLGTKEAELTGIFSPIYSEDEIKRYMGDYYGTKEGVNSQYQKMGVETMNAFYKDCFTRVFNFLGQDSVTSRPMNVLEIGCGFGFATLPLLELLPNSHYVATDLSLPILALLKQIVTKRNNAALARMEYMQLNAEQIDHFTKNSFEIIAGTAILHHLIDPEKTILACQNLLSPKGMAVFFEPFENGYAIMGLIYQEILEHPKARKLPRATVAYLKNTLNTWREMAKIKDKTNPFFIGLDDKWLFTRSYFSKYVQNGLFRSITVLPLLTDIENIFSIKIRIHTAGNNIYGLPDWVWNISHKYDAAFSADLIPEFMPEGIIILQK